MNFTKALFFRLFRWKLEAVPINSKKAADVPWRILLRIRERSVYLSNSISVQNLKTWKRSFFERGKLWGEINSKHRPIDRLDRNEENGWKIANFRDGARCDTVVLFLCTLLDYRFKRRWNLDCNGDPTGWQTFSFGKIIQSWKILKIIERDIYSWRREFGWRKITYRNRGCFDPLLKQNERKMIEAGNNERKGDVPRVCVLREQQIKGTKLEKKKKRNK